MSNFIVSLYSLPQITKSVSAPEDLGSLASHVTADYSQLAVQGRLAAATAEPEEVIDLQTHGRSLFVYLSLTRWPLFWWFLDRVPDKDTCAGTGARLHCSRSEGWSAADQSIWLIHKERTYWVCTSRHWEGAGATQRKYRCIAYNYLSKNLCCSLLKLQFLHIVELILMCVCFL